MLNFEGRTILIVGATSGLGKALSIKLSELGASLILSSSNEVRLQTVQKDLKESRSHYVVMDLYEIDYIKDKIGDIVKLYGALDGVVYCVGMRSRRPLKMLTPGLVNEVLNINFTAFIELVRVVTKGNNYNSGMSIVGISSVSSLRGMPAVTAYAASKAAMDGAVRCLAKELASKDIRINTVLPGQIDTPAFEEFRKMGISDKDKTLERQYLGLGHPDDVAHVIAFLLSGASKMITGCNIPVDGGFLSS